MSDLISRKKISGYIKMIINPYGKPFEGTAYELGLKIIRYIDSMDSAYDIDNVIEELEKEAERWEDSGKEYKDKCEIAVGRGLRNSIKIVKQGVVSDDVCEWKSASDGEFIQNPHTKRLYSNEPSMRNVYCNTCGKKIKTVGD